MEATEKKCTVCQEVKPYKKYSPDKRAKTGTTPQCLDCMREKHNQYKRTKDGVTQAIYGRQREKSVERGHPFTAYDLKQLRKWAYAQEIFHQLYDKWVASGYATLEKPSFDRLDDYKPYSFDNLRIVTWRENQQKEYDDRKNGLNNKLNTAVSQYTKQGALIQRFHSQEEAARVIGIKASAISRCRRGLQKIAGGFIWKNQ